VPRTPRAEHRQVFGVAGSRSASGVRLGSEADVASPGSGGVRTSPLDVVSDADELPVADDEDDEGISLDELVVLPGEVALDEDEAVPGVVVSLDPAVEPPAEPGIALDDDVPPAELVSLADEEASAVRVRPGFDSDCQVSNSDCDTEPSPSASAVANVGSRPSWAAASLADTWPSRSLSSAVNESVVVSASAANASTLAIAPVREAAAYFIVGLLPDDRTSGEPTGARRGDQCAALATVLGAAARRGARGPDVGIRGPA
jgi:hypothetical protein